MDGERFEAAAQSTEADALYTPLPAVASALAARQEDRLCREVLRFARPPRDLLVALAGHPLTLSRHVASPNFEFLRFLELAEAAGLPAVALETPSDLFTPTVNLSKRNLAKLSVRFGVDGRGTPIFRRVSVVAFNGGGRPCMNELRCADGTPFVTLHHRLLAHVLGPDRSIRVYDNTSFNRDERPRAHYERAFALYTCFAALADSYLFVGPEAAFTESVVLPAFEAVVGRFGVRPLITPLLPRGAEHDTSWESYPAEVWPLVRAAAGK